MLSGVVSFLTGFGIAFYRSWEVSLVFVGMTPLLMMGGIVQAMIFEGDGDSSDPFFESGTVSQEIFINIRTVLAFPNLITTKTKAFTEKVNLGFPIALKR